MEEGQTQAGQRPTW